jgi:GntR family transcriptional repressor for pyruvate dehydrogenase complex
MGVARKAAERITTADLLRLKQMVVVQRDLVFDPLSFRVSDLSFHTIIMEATGNSFIVRTSSALYFLGMEYRRIASETPGVLEQSLADHELIVAALERRDGEAAAQAVEQHLRNVHRSTVDAMEKGQ